MFPRFPSPVPVWADARPAPERLSSPSASVTQPCFCRPCPSPARAALSYRVRVWAFSAIEFDRLSNILKTFNDQFGHILWEDEDRGRRLITEEIPAKVAEDTAYRNARENSDRQNARIGVLWLFDRMFQERSATPKQLYDGLVRIRDHPRRGFPKAEVSKRLQVFERAGKTA